MGTAGGSDNSTAYCPDCGNSVVPEDSYCGECGRQLAASEASTEKRHQQFRARVSDHVANGWELQYDGGDEVALIDREYGSIPIHVLLVMFTGGLGNIFYGWYHYEHNATRKVLRAHSSDTAPSASGQSTTAVGEQADSTSQDGTMSGYIKGLLAVVIGVSIFTSMGTTPVGLTLTVACLTLAMLFLPPTRKRIENRHPPTTFGPTTSVDEQYVTGTDKPCSVCFDQVERGIRREYEQSYVVAGVPLYTIERGENWYCEDCRETSVNVTNTLDAELAEITKESTHNGDNTPEDAADQNDEESTLTEDT
ncbi:hypothetical protein ACFQJ7_14590 [Halovenus rubra]|uniref:Zinc-ribbon domain-containing protein n=2 Tax=Halovenus rubra TaxID=869890 RepID=A0ABD5X7P7_9EURY|nr:hypothetical protein [Halovenus rubra]